jgi:hypothetical protein
VLTANDSGSRSQAIVISRSASAARPAASRRMLYHWMAATKPQMRWYKIIQELGDYDAALAAFRAVEAAAPEWAVAIAARGFVEGIAGRTTAATATLAQLRKLSQRRFVTPYGIALVEAGLGRRDAALASLETAFVEGSHWLVWLRLDPRWRELRSEPRFTRLVERMHFPA